MVDGDSSTLSTSERLRRLRQYSSNFRSGVFDRGEDPTAYPGHAVKMDHRGRRSRRTSHHETSFPAFFLEFHRPTRPFLSVFTHGSTQAGIQHQRWLVPLGAQENPHHGGIKWAVDDAQDLLVIASVVTMPLAGDFER